jgi:hypothetical protein
MKEPTKEARQALIVSELAAGLTPVQVREKHGIDRTTFWRDMLAVRGLLVEGIATNAMQWRTEQLIELAELRSVLTDPAMSKGKRVELALKIIDMESDLMGTKAPTKSVSASVVGAKGFEQCPMCGTRLDPGTGEAMPMMCVHEFVDPPVGEQIALPPKYPVPQLGLPESSEEDGA